MNTIASLAVLAQASDGLTFSDVVADVPHDPASIFVYVLLIVSGVLIWRGSRKKGGTERGFR